MPPDSTTSTHATPEPAWKTLTEFSLPNQSGSDLLAGERVAAAVRALNLSPANTERFKAAIADATLNAIQPSRQPGRPIHIRVLVWEEAIPARAISQSTGAISGSQTSNPEAFLAFGQPGQRGWGFFLIRKMEGQKQIQAETGSYYIELFLYREDNLG